MHVSARTRIITCVEKEKEICKNIYDIHTYNIIYNVIIQNYILYYYMFMYVYYISYICKICFICSNYMAHKGLFMAIVKSYSNL